MKTKVFQILFAITLIVSCGPKTSKSIAVITKETDTYISKVNANTSLKEETIEGALTDTEGFKDIGSFKYTTFFNEQSKQLYKIKNVEKTDKTITETYYFQDGNLVLIDANLNGKSNQTYIHKGKVLSENKTETPDEKLLLEKAKRFRKAFQEEH